MNTLNNIVLTLMLFELVFCYVLCVSFNILGICVTTGLICSFSTPSASSLEEEFAAGLRCVEKRDEQRQEREGRVVKGNESIDMCLTAIVACNYSHVHLPLSFSHTLSFSH